MKAAVRGSSRQHVSFVAAVPSIRARSPFHSSCDRTKVGLARNLLSRSRIVMAATDKTPRTSLLGGGALLACVLVNRVFFTPIDDMCPPQARSDILAVIASATLVLYGLGRIDLTERRAAVDMGGVEVEDGFDSEGLRPASVHRDKQVRWTARTLLSALPNVKSFALVLKHDKSYRVGRFRDLAAVSFVKPEGIAERALQTGERAYLADLKVVSVKEVEFNFFPENCQVRRLKSAPE
jgi:hypothetical protein